MQRDLSVAREASSVVGAWGRTGFLAEEYESRITRGRAGIRPQPEHFT